MFSFVFLCFLLFFQLAALRQKTTYSFNRTRTKNFYNVDVVWLSVPLYSDGKTPNIFLN